MGKKKVSNKKITWEDIYKDFKRSHPKRSIGVIGFRPHGISTILLYFPEKRRMIYNHDTGHLTEFVMD